MPTPQPALRVCLHERTAIVMLMARFGEPLLRLCLVMRVLTMSRPNVYGYRFSGIFY